MCPLFLLKVAEFPELVTRLFAGARKLDPHGGYKLITPPPPPSAIIVHPDPCCARPTLGLCGELERPGGAACSFAFGVGAETVVPHGDRGGF